jgi:SAM-dependent methyltransferase
MTTPHWDENYAAGSSPPWDIGYPQPAFVRLADDGLLPGRVLDVGCGTGEHALLAAARGADAVGVDVAPRAIERARGKAAERGIKARFEVADALSLADLGLTFDTVIDSGLFHVFDDQDRARYVASLAAVLRDGGRCYDDLSQGVRKRMKEIAVLRDGGRCYLMCFSDRQPGDFGPRRVSQDELRAAFRRGWKVASITADTFEINPGLGTLRAEAWLAAIERTADAAPPTAADSPA